VKAFFAYTIVGIATGSIYAVAASGLVVTYTTSGIFNFAHGAIGMVAAFTYWDLRVHRHWPAPIALIAVIFVLAPLLGAIVERGLMRRLEGATVATTLVISLGLLVMLLGLGQGVWPAGEARQLPQFFGSSSGFHVAGIFITTHQLMTILLGGAVAVGLWYLLNRTRIGIAMRAVVDDRNLMALNGAAPARVSQFSWALGASLAALAGVLIAPLVSLDAIQLTLLVVNAYAAAMLGRLRSLPLTFAGGFALGLVTSYTVGYVKLQGIFQGLRSGIPTLFLFLILLIMPQARLRVGRLVGARSPRIPGPRDSLVGAGALVAASIVVSLVLSAGNLARAGQGLAFGLVMLSLVMLTGYGGQVSLCQLTFAGLGAFAMAKMGGTGTPFGIIGAFVLAAAVGALVALPSLRLQGLYLALSTMAFAVLMDNMVFPDSHIFGFNGALKVGRLNPFDSERAYFVLLAIFFAAFALLVLWIRRGPFGRVLAAMRDSPAACATLGLSLTRTKLAVFTLSAGMAGVAGALYGGLRTTAGPTDFLMFQSLPILLMAVIGGITTASGALLGGMLYALLPVLQEKLPALGGVVFLVTGAVAVSLGRNPNGLAFFISDRLGRYLPYRRDDARPSFEDTVQMEEIRVGAPTG
jgi:branched-chain amino acid transport system permease protein